MKSDNHTPPVSSQVDLQKRLSRELHDHAWKFDANRVAEMLHDDHCVLGRASRVLLMRYPTGEGEELEPCIPALGPTVRTRKHRRTETQMEQGDKEIRTSFHH